MDGGAGRQVRRRKSLKERLSLKRINCCGASWGLVPATISVRDDDEDDDDEEEEVPQAGEQSPPVCAAETPTGSGMNLAAALAAERQFRAVQDSEVEGQSQIPAGVENSGAGTPLRVSLMRLLEESDGRDGETTAKATEKDSRTGSEAVCCICMGRKKGAAFIPCGHTFCRVCSRELWLNRGSCPLCNRSILEILDIY